MSRLKSLKARLTALAVAAVAVTWLATAVFTWFEARHEIDEMLDGHLAQAASMLIVQGSHDLDEIDTEHAPMLHKYARKVAFQIWEDGRELRLHSLNAPSTPLGGEREGFSEHEVDGRHWRVFSTWNPGHDMLVHVAEQVEARDDVARQLAGGLLMPLVFALPVLALLLWLVVGRGLVALEKVAAEVSTRAPDNLSPLATSEMPAEILPLAERLNELFGRLAHSLDNERRFTADAAHELRTPLAGIRAQAQVAMAAVVPAEQRRALESVLAGCDRATRLVEQLLTLARLDVAPASGRVRIGLRALAAEALADMATAAARKHVDLALADGDDAAVDGHDGLLRVLLRNLLDNALRYSPPGSAVEVRVGSAAGRAVLVVGDNGPGIAEAERAKVLERFYRVLGSGEDGSGLGLSIVRRIVELHGGSLELCAGPAGRGLEVHVALPTAG